MEKELQKEQLWYRIGNLFAWKADKLFEVDSRMIPCWVFINKDTGETRGFAQNIAEKKGEDFYLKLLNE